MRFTPIALTTSLFLLAACSSSRLVDGGTTVIPQGSQTYPQVVGRRYKHECFGVKGVTASPCPVKLNNKNQGGPIAVMVSGRGVVKAQVIETGCYGKGSPCNVGGGGTSNPTQFEISSTADYTVCGKATVAFAGLNSKGRVVGDTHITVINHFCPGP